MALFLVLLVLTGVTRLVELNISRVHRREMFRKGAVHSADPGFIWMVLLHIGILLGSLLEVVLFARTAPTGLAVTAALGVVAASSLRVWAIRSLGRHWNVRIVDSTSLGIVDTGPYRYLRHPNYVAVFLELALLPLVQGAWITALVGTVLHFFVLKQRVAHEEVILLRDKEYAARMRDKPRFLPLLRWDDRSSRKASEA